MGSGEGTGVELGLLEIQSSLISTWTIWLLTSPLHQVCLSPMLFSNPIQIGNFQSSFNWAFWLHWTLLIILSFSQCSVLSASMIPHRLISSDNFASCLSLSWDPDSPLPPSGVPACLSYTFLLFYFAYSLAWSLSLSWFHLSSNVTRLTSLV